MAKFAFVYHGGSQPETDEERQQVMDAWMAWFRSMGDAVVNPGNPLGMSSTVHADGSVTDDGGANPAGGYSVVKANDLGAAIELAKGCPIREAGGTIEVAEAFDIEL